jgi:D-alanyl-D-alanine carboxypeptidase
MEKNTFNKKENFKNNLLFFLLFSFLSLGAFLLTATPTYAKSNPKYASIVIDADTGLILSERYADKVLHPASLAKVMTLMLTFDALKEGKLRLRDRIIISRHAESMVPSKLGLKAGTTIRVEDAIYALVTKSANDVAVALAEELGGTESHFALKMTHKARQIGMNKTRFRNASGLHNRNQVSTARDIATMSRYLINEYPEFYHYFSTRKFSYRGTTYRNHNRLMDSYKGMDGLKTGYIQASGFNLAASAVRNNKRLIGVVFGGRTGRTRNAHMATLLNRGFSKLDKILLASLSAPIPPRKPKSTVAIASLNSIAPASGELNKLIEDLNEDTETKWASLNPVLQNSTFSKMIGEGDYDPAVSKRLETGLIAIAAHKSHKKTHKKRNKAMLSKNSSSRKTIDHRKSWSIQIGAFSSRNKTDIALVNAVKKLPHKLSDAAAIIVPLKTKDGWLFRARLSGYNKVEAIEACKFINACMIVSPQAF